MVEIIGRIQSTDTANRTITDTWRMPAPTERFARRFARANSRVKGRSNYEIVSVEEIEDGDLPGQSIYEVVVQSER